jgi:D-serine deaminase-like pyridoxal phosphate-dependent protein
VLYSGAAQIGAEEDPQAIGTAMRWRHEALESYPGRLPHSTTLFDEAVRVLDHTALDASDKRLAASSVRRRRSRGACLVTTARVTGERREAPAAALNALRRRGTG